MTPESNLFDQLVDGGPGTALGALIKPLLERDPVARRRLAALDGKILRVEITAPAIAFSLLPGEDGLVLAGLRPDPDATIRVPISRVIALLGGEPLGDGVEVRGDTAFANELRSILRSLDIDWEGLLGDLIGDLAAHPLAELVRSGGRWLSDSRRRLLDNIDNYLHEELRLLPSRAEVEGFCDEVDALRLRADRLAARIDRLQRTRVSSES